MVLMASVWDGPTHLRDPAVPTMSLCGLGYAWPSSIALERPDRPADCPACLARVPSGGTGA